MSGINLISDPVQRQLMEDAVDSTWQTLKRPFQLYVKAQVASISTNPSYSRFGPNDQNHFNPAVNPEVTTIYGTITYGTDQPWEYIAPENRTNYMQDKIRNSSGRVRFKVDAAGYKLMMNCKLVEVDGFQFKLVSNAKPHGLFSPVRYTFFLESID